MIRFLMPQLPAASAIERYFDRSRETRWFSNDGPCLRLLVERAERFLGGGVRFVPTANCTLALMLGLRALAGRPQAERSEVVLPSFTFPATVDAVLWCGFTPVFADVDAHSWHLSPDGLAEALAARRGQVAAVLACSTFGCPPPPAVSEAWSRLTSDAGVPLLVDSAAGFGAVDERGVPLGSQGDAEVFSFHATKPLPIGEGGALATRSAELAESVRRLANFGFGPDRVVEAEPGLNAKLDEWHAAAALAGLDSLDDVLAARRTRAAHIRGALEAHGYEFQQGSELGTWQFVPVLAPSASVRDAVLVRAREAEVEVRSYFDPPLHQMTAFAGYPHAGSLAVTESLAKRMLSLPMANDLSADALDRITACVLGSPAVSRVGAPAVPR